MDQGFPRIALGSALVAVTLLVGFRWMDWLQPAELYLHDTWSRLWTRDAGGTSGLVLVELTEEDIARTGEYPVSDARLAAILQRVADAEPLAIGLDIYRDHPIPPSAPPPDDLATVLARHDGIERPAIVGVRLIAAPRAPAGLDEDRLATSEYPLDGDGVLRRTSDLVDTEIGVVASLPFLLAQQALAYQITDDEDDAIGGEVPSPERWESYRLPLRGGGYDKEMVEGTLLVSFLRRPSLDRVSFAEVLEDRFDRKRIKDKIVLVGVTADTVPDGGPTPIDPDLRGLELHAWVTDYLFRLLQGETEPPGILPEWFEWLLIVLLASSSASLASLLRHPTLNLSILLGGAGFLALTAAVLFRVGWWWPAASPLTAWLLAGGTAISIFRFLERRNRQAVRRLFSRHVGEVLAADIWRHRELLMNEGKIPGRTMPVTILMSDLKGYSGIAERLEPNALFAWLDAYMEEMADLVMRHRGVVKSYFGDAIYGVFGAPLPRTEATEVREDARRAVATALAMEKAARDLNAALRSRSLPEVRMRIGIASGDAICGSFGGRRAMEYAVLGDPVNTAARLESLPWEEADSGSICRILVSEATWEKVESAGFSAHFLGEIALKGKEAKARVYRIVDDEGNP